MSKYYAVHNGRGGTQIYTTWEETKANVSRYSGAIHKSFRSLREARAWLLGVADAATADASPAYPGIAPSQDPVPSQVEPLTQQGVSQIPLPLVKKEEVEEWFDEPFSEEEMDVDNSTEMHTQEPSAPSQQDTPMDDTAPREPPPVLAPPEEPRIELSVDQQKVLDMVKRGDSVFFTGSAGTGKSVLLREIIKLRGGRPSIKLGVTASTGIASVNIGGCTLHSWAGIGLGKEDKDTLVAKILGISMKGYKLDKKKRDELWKRHRRGEQVSEADWAFMNATPEDRKNKILDRWRECRTLIIDEISMIDGKLFDKLEYIGRQLRNNELPFGGIQLVLSGDFCQLPPVPDKSNTGAQIPATFAFDAESWARCVGPPVILTKVFRQKDQKFVDMLNAMRFGRLSDQTARAFSGLSREVQYDDGIEPTELYPTRAEVESANSSRLRKLAGVDLVFYARDLPGLDEQGKPYPPARVERGLKDLVVPKTLPLKVGAQVMLVKNIIQGVLVNGSVGRVIGFYKPLEAMKMGIKLALPDPAERNGPDVPDIGGGAIVEVPLSQRDQAAVQQREEKIKQILRLNSVFPAVQFQNNTIQLCVPLTFEVNSAEGTVEAIRNQVPLILAWALSIHKSQGQTLQRVRVDLRRIFEKGQAYVALSRATRMETLQVVNFDPAKVLAHPRVLEWMLQQTGKYVGPVYEHHHELDEELEYWEDFL